MNVRFTAPLVLLAGLALAPACFVDVGDLGDPHAAGSTGQLYSCYDNSECARGEYCLRGFCRAVPVGAEQCRTSRDCGRRESCINGFCTEICAKDHDCSIGGCEENYCCMSPRPTDGGTPPSDGGTSGSDGGT